MHRPNTFGLMTAALAAAILLAAATAATAGDNRPPLGVRLVLSKVNLLLENKAYDQALEVIARFQRRAGTDFDPSRPDPRGYHHPRIYFAKGNCLMLTGKYRPAARAYGRAVEADPGFEAAWLNLARCWYELKSYARAGECFDRGYRAGGEKNPRHLYYSAVAFMLAGDNRRALARFDKLLAFHRQAVKPAWKENLVQVLLAVGKPRRALPFIKELAATYRGAKQVQWQEILIYQYLQLGMQKEALSLVRRLTAQAPTVARWWKALAHLELDRQDYRQALVALVVYSYLEPLKRREQKLLADLYLEAGIPAKAATAYSACLEEKPEPSLVRCLALAYQRLGRPAAALETIDRYAAKSNEPDLLMIRADLLYRLGRWNDAARAYRKVAESKCRHKARAWLMAGYAAWQARDLETSRKAFKMAARYSGNRKMALAALEQLKEVQAQ